MPIAAMRTRLTVEAPVDAPDGAAGMSRTFQPFGQIWAALTRLTAVETWDGDRQAQQVTWRIETHFRPDIDAGMRLRRGERIFDIETVTDPDGRRRRITIEARETSP